MINSCVALHNVLDESRVPGAVCVAPEGAEQLVMILLAASVGQTDDNS